MFKTFEYRIYPTEEQKILFTKHFGATRWIYNHFLNVCIDSYNTTKKKLTRFQLDKQLPQLKQQHPWLKEINAQSLCCSLAHLDSAYQRFFKAKRKAERGFPKFKSKHNKQSFSTPQGTKVSFEQNKIFIRKFKEGIQTLFHRQFQGTIKTCTIKKSKTNKYYICILVDNHIELPKKSIPSFQEAIGIDVGIKSFAVLSNGETINNPRYLSKSLKRLKQIQQNISRKKKDSKNSVKIKHKLTLLHERIANQRKDFLHKLSTRLVRENQTLCIENLNIKGLLQNHKLARHIQDLGLGIFFSYLEYKTDWHGKNLLTIGTFEPSSKTCSACGGINKSLTLADRIWVCTDCGTVHNRDHNAAKNIKDFAFVGLRNQAEVTPTSYEAMEPQSRKHVHTDFFLNNNSSRYYTTTIKTSYRFIYDT